MHRRASVEPQGPGKELGRQKLLALVAEVEQYEISALPQCCAEFESCSGRAGDGERPTERWLKTDTGNTVLSLNSLTFALSVGLCAASEMNSFLESQKSLSKEERKQLPFWMFAHLAAILAFKRWQHAGISQLASITLPSPTEVASDLARAIETNDPTFKEVACPHTPCARFIRVMLERMAWEGHSDVGAEVLVGDPDEDSLIEAVAQLLWNCRREQTADADLAGDPT